RDHRAIYRAKRRAAEQTRSPCHARKPAAHQIRVRHQPANGQDDRPRHSADLTRARRRGDRMKRREFITLLGGGAAAWPLAAHAQRSKPALMGLLGSGTAAAQSEWTAAFVQRLRQLGWSEGRNLTIEYRWAEGRSERFAEIAAEFVRLKVDVIVTHNTAPPLAAKRATSVIPIVFATAGDPVGTGVVESLARPGGKRHRPVESASRSCREASRTLARARARSAPVGVTSRARQSLQRAGVGRGCDGGAHARSRSHAGRNPARRRYPSRF